MEQREIVYTDKEADELIHIIDVATKHPNMGGLLIAGMANYHFAKLKKAFSAPIPSPTPAPAILEEEDDNE